MEAEITNVEALKEIYAAGDSAKIRFEAEDNRSSEDNENQSFDYRAVLVIEDIKGRVVFDSHQEDEDEKFTLDPGETGRATFTWDIPITADPGHCLSTTS